MVLTYVSGFLGVVVGLWFAALVTAILTLSVRLKLQGVRAPGGTLRQRVAAIEQRALGATSTVFPFSIASACGLLLGLAA